MARRGHVRSLTMPGEDGRIRHIGAWHERASSAGLSLEREAAFAARWEAECDRGALQELFLRGAAMPGGDLEAENALLQVNQRDASVAATVIQWLGTHAGFAFLQSALDQCGYELSAKPVQDDPNH